jgi:hypothetical protein
MGLPLQMEIAGSLLGGGRSFFSEDLDVEGKVAHETIINKGTDVQPWDSNCLPVPKIPL